MEIYRFENRLLMVVDVTDDFDWKGAMDRLQKLPLQAEWEEFMNTFQQTGDRPVNQGKWKPMTKIFSLSTSNS